MYLLMILAFVVGYVAIAMEHPLRVDKSASALLTGAVLWTLLILGHETILPEVAGQDHAALTAHIDAELMEHLSDIAAVLFFLMGAMTIVELVDSYDGFSVVTSRIRTREKVKLLWIIGLITFFFSSVLDNLTTAIVMAALLRKLIHRKEDLWYFGGIVVIAANAGGAWSPIGDVTTIMLWIGGQVTAANIVTKLIVPSLLCLFIPLGIASLFLKGKFEDKAAAAEVSAHGGDHDPPTPREQRVVLFAGVGALLAVPVFKTVTHLPPFMGIMAGLGILWVLTEVMQMRKAHHRNPHLTVSGVIRRVDMPSVLFFLGILLAVAALETSGHLEALAHLLDSTFGNIYIVNVLIGILSAVVDNVPLVAGAMGMYPMSVYPQDHLFWELLAYCAGTGGSMLIIGSAAGVAIMGILKIDFLWYLRRIAWLAAAGYFAGVVAYFLMQNGG